MKKKFFKIMLLTLVFCMFLQSFVFAANPVTGLKLDVTSLNLDIGQTHRFTVGFTPSNTADKLVNYSSSNTKVAKVDIYGTVSGISSGTAVITVTNAVNKKISAKCSVKVAKLLPDWTKDKSPITLDWFIDQSWFTTQWDAEKSLVFKTVTEKTGVKVNWQVPSGDGNDKLNVMIASNEFPDMLTISMDKSQIKILEKNGKVQPLTGLINQYAPGFNQILPKSLVQWNTAADGKFYGIPNYFGAREKETGDTRISQNSGIIVRKDLLGKLGLKLSDLSTQKGVLAALEKVKSTKLKYNGRVVTPLLLPPEADVKDGFFLYETVFPSFFGQPLEDRNGKLLDIKKTPKYLEGLKFINECYRKGYINKNNFLYQQQQINEKLSTGEVFMAIGNIAVFMDGYKALYDSDNKAIFVAAGPMQANDGTQPTLIGGGMNGWTATFITKDSKKASRAIRFMEFMYSDEGSLLGHWGVEGVTYTKGTDGYFHYTEKYLKERTDNSSKAALDYGLDNLKWVHNWQVIVSKMPMNQKGAEKVDSDIWAYYPNYIRFDGRALSKMEISAGSKAAIAQTNIKSYLIANLPKALMAKSAADCEKEYNKIIATIYTKGQDEINKVRDENFQKNKKQLGLKYMGPWY